MCVTVSNSFHEEFDFLIHQHMLIYLKNTVNEDFLSVFLTEIVKKNVIICVLHVTITVTEGVVA